MLTANALRFRLCESTKRDRLFYDSGEWRVMSASERKKNQWRDKRVASASEQPEMLKFILPGCSLVTRHSPLALFLAVHSPLATHHSSLLRWRLQKTSTKIDSPLPYSTLLCLGTGAASRLCFLSSGIANQQRK